MTGTVSFIMFDVLSVSHPGILSAMGTDEGDVWMQEPERLSRHLGRCLLSCKMKTVLVTGVAVDVLFAKVVNKNPRLFSETVSS